MDKETKPKKNAAQDNPWYRLATLHGHPTSSIDETLAKNRETWNRWMASKLSDSVMSGLRANGWPSENELTPFSDDERQAIAEQVGLPIIEANWIHFFHTRFEADFCFRGFVFSDVDFRGATFSGSADFRDAIFGGRTYFEDATFSEDVSFLYATFLSDARFGSAILSGEAIFASTTFRYVADFESAKFGDFASFNNATFHDKAFFRGATFRDGITFMNAIFSDIADFVNAEMEGPTTFDEVTFSSPPRCFGAKLHEGTTWHRVKWPRMPFVDKAEEFADAYERLKLEMDKLKKHRDELEFFARELQCQQVILRWKGLPIALYGALCGHGRSYMRPLGILVVVVIVGAVPIRAHFGGGWCFATFTGHPIGGGALGLSFANTVSFLGIRKDLIDPGLLLALPGWLKVVATIQTILGIVLLFLFGVGIRNRFRIK